MKEFFVFSTLFVLAWFVFGMIWPKKALFFVEKANRWQVAGISLALLFVFVMFTEVEDPPANQKTAKREQSEPKRTVLNVSAKELTTLYAANHEKAKEDTWNKQTALTGRVTNVGAGYVLLNGYTDLYIRVNFYDEGTSDILSPGEQISIRGIIGDYDGRVLNIHTAFLN